MSRSQGLRLRACRRFPARSRCLNRRNNASLASPLTDKLAVIDGGGANVLAFSSR